MGRASSVAGALCVAARRGLAPGTRCAPGWCGYSHVRETCAASIAARDGL